MASSNHDHVWRSASYYAMAQMMEFAKGISMQTDVESETYDLPGYAIDDTSQYTGKEGVNFIDSASAWDKENDRLTIFVINRNEDAEYPLTLDVKGFEGYRFEGHTEMYTEDMELANSYEDPNVVVPMENKDGVFEDGMLKTHVKPLSWNVFRFVK